MKEYLSDSNFTDVRRMFFITNLKTNLPNEGLYNLLTEEEKEKCLRLKAYNEDVIANWASVRITIDEIKNGKEYKALNADIGILNDLKAEKDRLVGEKRGDLVVKKQKAIDSFQKKIAVVTEPAFRKLISKNYFYGKSTVDKKKFVRDNEWLVKLYPVCMLEQKKVIFMTTEKFFAPINLFYRMPFYMYSDKIIEEAVVFIDEFDSSKKPVLEQLIANSLKINLDIVSLFTNIHYVLQGCNFPKKLLQMAKDKGVMIK
ncbi:hypothetical protein [Chryseobacterium sp.]|uniref:hypothetical protein n=1 Tax=Chryseobacterium sp. TaxID=1871047 RepID=UPI002FC9067F